MEVSQHNKFMERALQIARENVGKGGGPFGAVIVKEGELISEAGNRVAFTNDPTAHAEISAIRAATEKTGSFDLSGCIIYSSCEPCLMCLSAIYWARIKKVFYSNSAQEAAEAGFDDLHLCQEIAKDAGEREIIMNRIVLPDAGKAFEDWKSLEGRIEY